MEILKILVPTGLDKDSDKGLARATEYAAVFGAEIVVAHVVQYLANFGVYMPDWIDSNKLEKHTQEFAEAELARACEACAMQGVKVDSIVRYDQDIDDGIVSAAKDTGADLIIMTRHGRTAGHVVGKAPCDVLVLK